MNSVRGFLLTAAKVSKYPLAQRGHVGRERDLDMGTERLAAAAGRTITATAALALAVPLTACSGVTVAMTTSVISDFFDLAFWPTVGVGFVVLVVFAAFKAWAEVSAKGEGAGEAKSKGKKQLK